MAKNRSHTPYNKLVDGIREVAKTEAEIGHAPREFSVSPEPVPFPFKDGRVDEQDLKGHADPDVMDLAKSTKGKVKPLGKEGGKIPGKDGDRLKPHGDTGGGPGTVDPDEHIPGTTPWSDVVRNNLEKRKRAEGRDSGEGTNESVDDDERAVLVEEIEEFIADAEPTVLAEQIVDLMQEAAALQAANADLQSERDDLMDQTLRQQLLLHIADFTKSMTLLQAQKFLDRAIDVVDLAKMSVDNQYLARTLGRLKEEVVREGRRSPRAGTDITEGFADYESLRDERVAPITDVGMKAVHNALKIFR